MTSSVYELTVLDGAFAVCRFAADAPVPAWALEPQAFVAITRTAGELSVIADEARVPAADAAAVRWRGLEVRGPFPFDTVGVLATLSQTLAQARVSLLAVSTHDTDYLFVPATALARAVRALRHDGHTVHTPA